MNHILDNLKRLGAEPIRYDEICKLYLTAKLIITYSKNGDYLETIRNSLELKKYLHIYQEVVSTAFEEKYIDSWVELCTALHNTGLDVDYRAFFDSFAPNVVEDWDKLWSQFPTGRIGAVLLVLALLTGGNETDIFDMSRNAMQERYSRHASMYKKYGLNLDAFERCWRSVYSSEIVDADNKPNENVSAAMEIYHKCIFKIQIFCLITLSFT